MVEKKRNNSLSCSFNSVEVLPNINAKAASRVKLHHQEMLLVQVGSPLAIENAHRNLLDMEDDE